MGINVKTVLTFLNTRKVRVDFWTIDKRTIVTLVDKYKVEYMKLEDFQSWYNSIGRYSAPEFFIEGKIALIEDVVYKYDLNLY